MRIADRPLECGSMRRTEARAFPVGLLKRVREPYHTPGVVAVAHAIRMGKFVDCLSRRAMDEPLTIRCVEAKQRTNSNPAFRIRLAENEAQIWRVQVNDRDAQ